MKSIFIRIYGSTLLAAISLILIFYSIFNVINETRYERYLINNVAGALRLVTAGIARHEGVKRQQWIDAVERLTGMSINVSIAENLNDFARYKLEGRDQTIYISFNTNTEMTKIVLPLPNDNNSFVITEFSNNNQAMSRVTALLILNELGRHPKTDRIPLLNNLDKGFSYELSLVERHNTDIDNAQWRQLSRGDIVTSLNITPLGKPFLDVYVRYGNSGLLLHLGPITLFQPYPISLVLPLIVLAGLALLFFGFLLVHSLEKKLRTLEEGISKAGTNEALPIHLPGTDGLSRMAESINSMMVRISSLVNQQRQLTNDISHELRTPVARVMFRVESIVANGISEDDGDIAGIKKDLKRLDSLIAEMLTCAQLDYTEHVDLAKIDLVELLREITADMEFHYPNVKFLSNSRFEEIVLNGDKVLLVRSIENLLINACRYSKTTVKITLGLPEKTQHPIQANLEECIRITIEDDGPGVPIEDRERIFTPFARIDSSRSNVSGGVGLGLAIVQRIVHLHHGKISADSSPTIGGARFSMVLPVEHSKNHSYA